MADCGVEPLPLLPGMSNVFVVDGDSTGRYLLGEAHVKGERVDVVWDRDDVRVLGEPSVPGSLAHAVNSAGVVADRGRSAGTARAGSTGKEPSRR